MFSRPLKAIDARPVHPLRRGLLIATVATLSVLGLPSSAAGAAQSSELASALVITKSTNRNQVNYAVRVDETCAPAGPSPVHPYWRMLEHGPSATEQLSDGEQRVLGVGQQDSTGNLVRVALRGIPSRPITIQTGRGADGQCASAAYMTIAGVAARVAGVFVQQRLFGISYVLLTGWADNGAVVRERIVP
jgi:hypothetical protein